MLMTKVMVNAEEGAEGGPSVCTQVLAHSPSFVPYDSFLSPRRLPFPYYAHLLVCNTASLNDFFFWGKDDWTNV
jgi:hypothetical protein